MRLAIVLSSLVLVAGCANYKPQQQLDQTLDAYGAALRWGDFESALRYVDPKVLEANPPTALQLERYRQVRVSGYEASGAVPVGETEVRQRAVIGLINIHTQVERSIVDNQLWRYDPKLERWFLESGLPHIVE